MKKKAEHEAEEELLRADLKEAVDFWAGSDHILVRLEGASKSRKERATAMQQGIKSLYSKHDKSKIAGSVKAAIKRDDLGRMLGEEAKDTRGMYYTLSTIQEMATKLASSRAERARKKSQEAEAGVRKAQDPERKGLWSGD